MASNLGLHCLPRSQNEPYPGVASALLKTQTFNGQFTDLFNKSVHREVPFLSMLPPFMNDVVVSNYV